MTDPGDARGSSRAPADPFVRYSGRLLDPTTSAPRSNGEPPSPTAYRADTVIVSADSKQQALEILDRLTNAAASLGAPLQRSSAMDPFLPDSDPNSEHSRRARMLERAAALDLPLVFSVRFIPPTDGDPRAPDVWPLVVRFRRDPNNDPGAVGLDHLMFGAVTIGGVPFMRGTSAIIGNPFMRGTAAIFGSPFMRGTSAEGLFSYLVAGSGGRGPVSVVAAAPAEPVGDKGPTVVVLDTGVGSHPMALIGARRHDLRRPGGSGTDRRSRARPGPGRQRRRARRDDGSVGESCGTWKLHRRSDTPVLPRGHLTAVRVMDADGVVPEVALTDVLTKLAIVQVDATGDASDADRPIDAVVLSLGYYSEAGDGAYTAALKKLLLALARRGVAIFCAAGNDSDQTPWYPAAFAVDPEFADVNCLPVASVAALNPDRTVALFSNDGTWVNAEALGVSLVSTLPIAFRGAWMQDTLLDGPQSTRRGTVDPDGYRCGFATWSGTSFAAPVLAGEYLTTLVREGMPPVNQRRNHVPLRRTLFAALNLEPAQ